MVLHSKSICIQTVCLDSFLHKTTARASALLLSSLPAWEPPHPLNQPKPEKKGQAIIQTNFG